MKKATMEMTVGFVFDPGGVPESELQRRCLAVIEDAVENGTVTGSSAATLVAWSTEIQTVKSFKKGRT